MNLSIMDLQHLESDELEVEFHIRNIDPKAESALLKLTQTLSEEEAGVRSKPVLPHPLKASSEIQLCKRKLSQMEQERIKHVTSGDSTSLDVLRSRACHMVKRLERLVRYASDNHAIPTLLTEATSLAQRLDPSNIEFNLSNDNNDQILQGFDDLGAAVFPNINATESASRPSTGAIRKSTTPVNNRPPPVSQSSQWQADSSIIQVGRTSIPPQSSAAFQAFVRQATGQPIGQAFGIQTDNLDFPPPPATQVDPAGQAIGQGRHRLGLTHILSKWTVRFGGSAKDLPIDEFFFRLENLAAADNVHADSLVLGLHCLLTGNASDFYWVQRRKNPNHAYRALKQAMIAHFARQETDLEIRKLIMERRQAANEGFGEFSLAVECLAARLNRGMEDGELMEILRQNMSSKLQTCLLMYPTPTVDALKGACRKYERLWASQTDSFKGRNINRRMAELGFDETPLQVDEINSCSVVRSSLGVHAAGGEQTVDENGFEVSAITQAKAPNRAEYAICWNCADIGHTFADCTSTDRKVFCYGCGEKNVYKPTCPNCSPGNPKSSGINPGRSRSNPFALHRSNVGHQQQ